MLLYPQLPRPTVSVLAHSLRDQPVSHAAGLAAFEHPGAIFTPTGGTRVSTSQLRELREALLQQARRLGYPGGASEDQRLEFDAAAAVALHSMMSIPPGEASKPGVWEFICCVLLPDLVRWRFPGGAEGTSLDRYLSGRRNVFQRLWWRAHLFHDPGRGDHPYALLALLGEDELVQIMERPNLAGIRPLTRNIAAGLLSAAERHPGVARRTLIREAQKRLMRLASFVSFDALDNELLKASVGAAFDQAAASIGS